MALKSSNGTLEYFAARYFEAFSRTNEMKKAKTGFLVKEIFERFKNKSLSLLKPDRTLWIYSGHDNTIINVLNAFNVYKVNTRKENIEIDCTIINFVSTFQFHIPPFAASIHLEMYKEDQEYYVQLFYRTDKSEYIPPINIPNCGIKCPLGKLFELFSRILPNNDETYESLCRLP